MLYYYHFIDLATNKPCMICAGTVAAAKEKLSLYKGVSSVIEKALRFELIAGIK
jgi:hypothetical protein